jgi:glycosyltransferase involved in cell wall biosynthesis
VDDADGRLAPGTTVVHVSSVHASRDPRIRRKQLAAVVAAGGRAILVTGDLDARGGDGVEVFPVRPGNRRRWLRLLVTTPRCVLLALRLRADVYHLHDPELLVLAWLLRLRTRAVIYDVHEDLVTGVRQKRYLPPVLAVILGALAGWAERVASAPLRRVIAERYYAERFPDATPVLNHPPESLGRLPCAHAPTSRRLLYTGTVAVDRGALLMADALARLPQWSLTVVGRCPPALADRLRERAGEERLTLEGRGRHVPFERIEAVYGAGGWFAGLALFPDTPHYREKELTKFFEYMAVGLPVIASDFPAWRRLVEGEGVGLCVDPEDPAALGAALDGLAEDPERARAMSRRGRELARGRYTWQREATRLLALYRDLSPAPRPAPPGP